MPGGVSAFTVIDNIADAGDGGRLTVVLFRVAVRPAGALALRLTLPTWPGRVVMSIVDQPEYPWTIDIEVGEALRRKSMASGLKEAAVV